MVVQAGARRVDRPSAHGYPGYEVCEGCWSLSKACVGSGERPGSRGEPGLCSVAAAWVGCVGQGRVEQETLEAL